MSGYLLECQVRLGRGIRKSEKRGLVGGVGKRGGDVLFAFVRMSLFGVDLLVSEGRVGEEAGCWGYRCRSTGC
jgi:hypothetical protein